MQRDNVPPGGVVTTTLEEWGRGRGNLRRPSIEVARTVVTRDPDPNQGPPILPPIDQVNAKVGKEIRVEGPPIIQTYRTVKTGAAERVSNKPLDEDLRRTRVYGNRPPLEVQNPASTPTTGAPPATGDTPTTETPAPPLETRRTGAVNRPQPKPIENQPTTGPPIIATPPENKKTETSTKEERRSDRSKSDGSSNRVETPKYDPPPTRTETPRTESPKRDEPRSEPRRSEPTPQKSEPKSEPKSETKSEPKVDKPSPPTKKDGR